MFIYLIHSFIILKEQVTFTLKIFSHSSSVKFCIFVFDCIAKTFESVPFICADEVGPTLEFSIPKFKEDQKQDKISFKIYDSENRKSFNIIEGNVEKKSSPIDTSYFFYNVKTLNKNDMQEINFQFF